MFPGIVILHGEFQSGDSGLNLPRPLTDLLALRAEILENLLRLFQYAGELSDGLQCNGNDVILSCWLPSDLTEGGVGHKLQRILAVLSHRLGGHHDGLHLVDGERHPGDHWASVETSGVCSRAGRCLAVFVQALEFVCLLCVLTLCS